MKSSIFVLLAAASGVAPIALSQQATVPPGSSAALDLRFGGGHSDNVRRTPIGESDSYSLAGITGDYSRTSRRLDTLLYVDIERRDYSDPTIEDEPFGSIDAYLDLGIVPERVSWLFNENYGQAQIDPYAPPSPFNQEQVNVFSTGPSFDLPLGSRTILNIAARRDSRKFEDSTQLDSDGESADLGVARTVSPTTTLGLTVTGRQLEYDIPFNDNRVSSWYADYQKQLASGDVMLALGRSKATFDATGAETDAPYVDFSWQRAVGARSVLTVSAANQLGDFGDGFGWLATSPDGSVPLPDVTLLTPNVFKETSAAVDYTVTLPRGRLSIGSDVVDVTYDGSPELDYDWRQTSVSYQRPLRAQLSLGVDASYAKRIFDESGLEDRDRQFRIFLERSFGQRMQFDFLYEDYSRSGTGPFNYDESVFRIVFRYRLSAQAASAAPAASSP
jgi:hypothetical protein